MSKRTPTFRTVSRPLPTERELERISSAIRSAAERRGFPAHVTDRYERWIFVFLAWCLKAPPYRVHKGRIGGFWKALSHRSGQGLVCEAMDALGFFFGALGGPKKLSDRKLSEKEFPTWEELSGGGPGARADASPAETAVYRPNPDLGGPGGSGAGAGQTKWTVQPEKSAEELNRYLPDGPLPGGIDPRAEVPTRTSSEPTEPNPSSSAAPSNRPDEDPPSDAGSRKDAGSHEDRRDGPATLFNPTGTSSPRPEHTEKSGALGEGGSAPDEEASTEASSEAISSEGISSEKGPSPPEQQVSLKVPRPLAERLRLAARRLGLPPGVFAARALDLVCDEVGIEPSGKEGAEGILEGYQAQLDLLHLGSGGPDEGTGAPAETDMPAGTEERENEAVDESPEHGSKEPGSGATEASGGSPKDDGEVGEAPFLDLLSRGSTKQAFIV